jgi:hypothetical protein
MYLLIIVVAINEIDLANLSPLDLHWVDHTLWVMFLSGKVADLFDTFFPVLNR